MESKYKIQVENSAPSQLQVARSVVWASEILATLRVSRVVDFGCGRLRNLKVLEKHFPHIILVDTELQCDRISDLVLKKKGISLITTQAFEETHQKYDAIFIISVLHIIPKPRIRKNIVLITHEKLKSGGYLITDVPTGEAYYRKRCTSENKYKDGWVMGIGSIKTFYKNYSATEFDRLITSKTTFTLFDKISVDHHIIRIWQKG